MRQYIAVDGDRLDMIIYRAYKSIASEIVDAVLSVNSHLLEHIVLQAGDVVNLPEIEVPSAETSTKVLW